MSLVKVKKLDFTNQVIYVGIDVHKARWVTTILTDEFEHKTISMDPEVKILVNYLKKNFPKATYYSAYEAGYSGFWIHKELVAAGIHNIVVNPADIPRGDKERRNKTDQVDSRKLAKELRNKNLKGIYVPTDKELLDRDLVRIRTDLSHKQARVKNQIKSFLCRYKIQVPEDMTDRCWSNKYIQWIGSIKMPTKIGDIAIKIHLKELQDIQNSIAEVLREIRELSRTPKYEKNVELLMTVPGVGEITSMIIATELCDINRFGNFKHLNGYVGLVPSEDSSGDEIKKGPINHRGNKILRTKLIESAWVAVRKDSALIQTFQKLSKRMKKCKAIIIIAKKLLSRIFFVLKNQKKYINGIVVDKA